MSEKTDRAVVVPISSGWSDIGAWSALWSVCLQETDGNVIQGDATLNVSLVGQIKVDYTGREGKRRAFDLRPFEGVKRLDHGVVARWVKALWRGAKQCNREIVRVLNLLEGKVHDLLAEVAAAQVTELCLSHLVGTYLPKVWPWVPMLCCGDIFPYACKN